MLAGRLPELETRGESPIKLQPDHPLPGSGWQADLKKFTLAATHLSSIDFGNPLADMQEFRQHGEVAGPYNKQVMCPPLMAWERHSAVIYDRRYDVCFQSIRMLSLASRPSSRRPYFLSSHRNAEPGLCSHPASDLCRVSDIGIAKTTLQKSFFRPDCPTVYDDQDDRQ